MTESLTSQLEEIETDHESPSGAPRWVKTLGIVLVVLLIAFLAMHLSGNAPMAGIHGS